MDIDWSQLLHNQGLFIACGLGALLLALLLYVVATAWTAILNYVEPNELNDSIFNNVYIKSSIAKYLPGNVMNLVGRNLLANKHNIKQVSITTATLIEIILFAGTTAMLGFLFMLPTLGATLEMASNYMNLNLLIIITLIGVIGIVLLIIAYLKQSNVREQVKRYTNIKFFRCIVRVMFSYSVFFIGSGLVLCGIIGALTGTIMELSVVSQVIGIYLISYFIGYITPGAPGGIGIRETILLVLLSASFSQEIAALASIFHRMTTVFSDMLVYCGVIVAEKLREKRGE